LITAQSTGTSCGTADDGPITSSRRVRRTGALFPSTPSCGVRPALPRALLKMADRWMNGDPSNDAFFGTEHEWDVTSNRSFGSSHAPSDLGQSCASAATPMALPPTARSTICSRWASRPVRPLPRTSLTTAVYLCVTRYTLLWALTMQSRLSLRESAVPGRSVQRLRLHLAGSAPGGTISFVSQLISCRALPRSAG